MNVQASREIGVQQATCLWNENSQQDTDAPSDRQFDAYRLSHLIGSDLHVYRIESLLGRGGMGWVFLGHHRDLHRPCAIKILAPTLAEKDPEYVEHFQNEGRAAASLIHPNVVTTHAIGQFDDLYFLEMEFLRGRSLQQRINEGPIPPLEAISIGAGIASGLAAAHREGLIHRDLKPDNVLLTHQGMPKITDFGLAKRLATGTASASQVLAGTPHFMAPELFHGGAPGPASDVYALGVSLYLMLCGRFPFTRPKLPDLILSITSDPLPNLREENPAVPLDIAECVYAMLSRSPGNRPRDGIEAMQYLNAVLGHARDLESLLHEALDHEPNVEWRRSGELYIVRVELADGRGQQVLLESSERSNGERLLSIYSVCGPADPGFYAEALRLNARMIHGALAMRDIDGVPHFVVLNNYPRSTVDAEEIRASILDAAIHGDSVEHQLTGGDRY